MPSAVDLPDVELDDMPDLSANLDTSPLVCAEPGCTNPIVKPARGRTPTRCEEHKNRKAAGANKSKASGKSWPKATEVESHLTNSLKTIGSLSAHFMADPFYGEHLAEAGPAVVAELVELAKDDRTLQRWLTFLAAPGKYGPLTSSILALVSPMILHASVKAKLQAAGEV